MWQWHGMAWRLCLFHQIRPQDQPQLKAELRRQKFDFRARSIDRCDLWGASTPAQSIAAASSSGMFT
jgi:hypothetical protein